MQIRAPRTPSSMNQRNRPPTPCHRRASQSAERHEIPMHGSPSASSPAPRDRHIAACASTLPRTEPCTYQSTDWPAGPRSRCAGRGSAPLRMDRKISTRDSGWSIRSRQPLSRVGVPPASMSHEIRATAQQDSRALRQDFLDRFVTAGPPQELSEGPPRLR